MSRRPLLHLLLAIGCAAFTLAASAQPLPGTAAPAFTLTDVTGKRVQLADFRGRYVVLEWNNPSCPFVQKHYDSGNMQALQKRFTSANVAWLTINSTAMSHREFRAPADLAAWMKERGGAPTALMLDPDGTVGRAYDARATPHMFVIDPKGTLIYSGAIDDKRSSDPADVNTAKNYVVAALDDAMAGRPVGIAHTQAYGCSIKYSD
ncbi:MAG TPA: thioredoxin family protein [Burkholderiaceae bacterium]|nr:thioredoxin family protein [Burkholderiaceae bacterium]